MIRAGHRAAVGIALLVALSPALTPALALTYGGSPVTTPAIRSAAESKYGTPTLTIYAADDANFAAAFSGVPLYAALQGPYAPAIPHVFAWHGAIPQVYDVTRDFPALMTATGKTVTSAASAIELAKAFAATANVELDVNRTILTSSDSSWLGVTVASPAASNSLGVWTVTLSTWNKRGGMLADWDIKFTSASMTRAEWIVRRVSVGPFQPDAMHYAPLNETTVTNVYGVPGHTLSAVRGGQALHLPGALGTLAKTTVTTRTNFDGSQWVVLIPSVDLPPPGTPIPFTIQQMANALANAAQESYRTMVKVSNGAGALADPCRGTLNSASSWEFTSLDPDCQLVIVWSPQYAGSGACYCSPDTKQVEIIVASQIIDRDFFYSDPVAHNSTSWARMMVIHEYFHALQTSVHESFPTSLTGGAIRFQDPQAVFAMSAFDPVLEFATSSQTIGYGSTWMNSPRGLCFSSPSYNVMGLFWGYLYSKDGPDLILKFLELVDVQEPLCWNMYNDGLGDALTAVGSSFTSLTDALTKFGRDVVAGQLSWGRHDGSSVKTWSTLLPPVLSSPVTLTSGASASVEPWEIKFFSLPSSSTYDIDCTSADGFWSGLLMTKATSASSYVSVPFVCATGAQIAQSQDSVRLVIVRTDDDTGSITVSTS